jgi:formamidopyrimidine-DNA glycosylase
MDVQKRAQNRKLQKLRWKGEAMPELPEIETIRGSLSRDLVGKKIKGAAVTSGKIVRRHKTAKDFRTAVEGHTIKSAQRLGKNLIFGLDNGTSLVIDLDVSGRILRSQGPKDEKPKHTHVVFTFTQGGEIRYVDALSKGELYVSTPPPEGSEVEISKFARLSVGGDGLGLRKQIPELTMLGIDPFEDQIGWDRFAAILRSRTTDLKSVLTDQNILAGLGEIYADEALFAAGLGHDRESESLSTIEIRRLHRAITEILQEAIKYGGTSLEKDPFRDPDGKEGNYQQYLQVYDREGLPCMQCRQPIKKAINKSQATFYCDKCQS